MRRTRRRNIRTFIPWISNLPTGRDCGMRSRASSASGWMQGVLIFRVDNPHTKAFPFWQWVIPELKAQRPRCIVPRGGLYPAPRDGAAGKSSAFPSPTPTSPGATPRRSSRSTCSNSPPPRYGNTFVPTSGPTPPTFCPGTCRRGGLPAFRSRLVLATTLTANYGIYGPAFRVGRKHPRQTRQRRIPELRKIRDQDAGICKSPPA